MSILRTSQAGIDLLPSAMLTAKRNQKFNASSAESFHRKRRAETLSTLPVLQSSVSPQITFEELKHILPCLHSQNTNLTALKGGSSATTWVQATKNEQFLVKSSTTASWVTALLPARQDRQLTCFYNTRWKDEESNQALIPIQKANREETWSWFWLFGFFVFLLWHFNCTIGYWTWMFCYQTFSPKAHAGNRISGKKGN